MRIKQSLNKYYQRVTFFLVIAITLAAACFAFFQYWQASATYGIGINSDSIAYIRAAENLLAGNGLGRVSGLGSFKPMTHWPPLYSIILAGTSFFNSDLYSAARILGASLVFVILLLTGIILYRMCGSLILTTSGLSLLVAALPFWETTFRIMSEPLFLVWVLSAVLALDTYLQGSTRKWLVLSAGCMALAMLTRYAAITFILPACVLLLRGSTGLTRERIHEILLYLAISCIPLGIWILSNQWIAGSATNRVFQFFPLDTADVDKLWSGIISWFAPILTTFHIGSGKIIISAILIGIFLLLRSDSPSKRIDSPMQSRWLVQFWLWLIPIYAAFILVSRLFFDSMIQIYRERIIFPLFLAFLLLILAGIAKLISVSRNKSILLSASLVVILGFIWVSFFQGYKMESDKFLAQAKSDGIGFAAVRQNPPKIIQEYLALPASDVKLSNNIELFYLLTGQDALTLSDDFTRADIDRLNQYLQDRSATYIVLNSRKIERHLVETNPDVSQIYQDEGGGIYRYQ